MAQKASENITLTVREHLNLKISPILRIPHKKETAKNRFAATLTNSQGGPLVELKPNLICHFYDAVQDTLHDIHVTGAFLPDKFADTKITPFSTKSQEVRDFRFSFLL